MKTINKLYIILFISIIAGNTAISQTTIPNPGFENWVNGEPEHWDTSNKNILGAIFHGVLQDSINPQDGSSAAMLVTTIKTVGTFPVTLPGMLTLGEIIIDFINQTGTVTTGIPFSGRPDEFKGFYKTSPANGDSCYLGIGFFKWNGTQNDTIAFGQMYESSKIQNWTEFEIPIDYGTTANPDSMNIIISSSDLPNMSVVLGSTIWVDNLSLVYGGVSVIDLAMNDSFAVYPDETRENLLVSLSFQKTLSTVISLFSIDGKIIYNAEKKIENSIESINISNLPAGIYVVDVRCSDGNRYTQKVGIN